MSDLKGAGLFIGMVVFMLLFTYGGAFGWGLAFGAAHKFAPNTAVSGEIIEGLTEDQSKILLNKQVNNWKQAASLQLVLPEETVEISPENFRFHIPKTIASVSNGDTQNLQVTLDPIFAQSLTEHLSGEVKSKLQLEKLKEKLLSDAGQLKKGPLTYSIYDFIPAGIKSLYETQSSFSITRNDRGQLQDYVSEWKEVTLKPNQDFSLLTSIKQAAAVIDKRSLNQLATVLYGAVLDTNLVIKERHISENLPSYADYGREASVDRNNDQDLIFTNPNPSPLVMSLSMNGSTVEAEISGYPLQHSYHSVVEGSKEISERTVIHLSSFVPEGDIQVKQKGSPGKSVEVFRETKDQKVKISTDYYPPTDRVELRHGVEGEGNSAFSSKDAKSSSQDSSSLSNSSGATDSWDAQDEEKKHKLPPIWEGEYDKNPIQK
ncbi:VanW family protein [Halobacillus rhizosphaerae]|uniref:VanW family protein n=1 Tax=Halobacillus rhizosphaerae TaxID=3064889 RepID=UPI00398B88A5